MFFDLNFPVLRSSIERDRRALLCKLSQDGYDCVALNAIIHGRLPKQHRCSVARITFDPQALPPATGDRQRKLIEPSLLRVGGVSVLAPGHAATAEAGPDQVTRLTVVLENPSDAQLLAAGSDAVQSYDVVAAVPCCQRSFEVLCKDSDVDVISLPAGQRLPFTITKKNADAALARGAVFEVTYSQAIESSSARRSLISNCQRLVQLTRGRGIILTSGAETWLHARAPHDVANLGQLLGLSQEQSLRAVSDTPLAVLRRAEARKNRFRGITIDGGSADDSRRLQSLQIPREFYLPDAQAVAVAGLKKGTATATTGREGAAVEGEEEDSEEDDGFLSFGNIGGGGGGGMDVDA